MKKLNIAYLSFVFIAMCMITGCKKEKKVDEIPPANTKPSDQQGSSEADEAMEDVNDFINNKIGGGSNQKVSAYNLPCGVVSIDSSTTNGTYKNYIMNYGSQTPCGYKKKSGYVTFALLDATKFNDVGATYKITFTNYVVESLVNGQKFTMNGYITVKNVNGGYIWQTVTASATITHKIRGTFSVTYFDGTVRNRSYYQMRTYSSSSGWSGLTLTIAGDTTINSATIYEIGKTYENNYDYQTEMINSFVWSNCGSTYAGPYVLKTAYARMKLIVPFLTNAYIDVEGGYKWDLANTTATPVLVNDCTTNAYKITTVINSASFTQYQLY